MTHVKSSQSQQIGMDTIVDLEARSMEPAERIKALAAFANSMEVDFNVPIRRLVERN